ncbi:MAG: hypothetical protein Q7T76_20085 [Ferruginibacter sp.]|nr:hypothetical protein [Ferruginibacter sp.]
MKKLYLLMTVLSLSVLGVAQAQNTGQKRQDIEALKVAFISRDLELTPDEAQKFWPIYNEYSKEMRTIVADDQDVLDRDEKVLNLRKRYRDQFTRVIGEPRMNRLYNAEAKFRQLLIKSMRNQRAQRNNVP